MFRTFVTAASSIALLSGAAFAQDAAQSQDLSIETPEYTSETMSAEAVAPDANLVTTKDDARAFGEAEFNIADANADGKVDQSEFITYANANLATDLTAETAVGEGDATVTAQVGAEADASATPEETFAELSEGKQEITQDEMVDARVAAFEEADANGDEQLDDSEKQQFAALVSGRAAS